MYHRFLIHSSADGHLGFFHVLAIINTRRRRQKKDHEKILEEIIVENFPKMRKEIANQVQETQRVPKRINSRQNTPRHRLIKLMKVKHKEEILKVSREKQHITHKGIPTRITTDLSIEILQARREWQDILKVVKKKKPQKTKKGTLLHCWWDCKLVQPL